MAFDYHFENSKLVGNLLLLLLLPYYGDKRTQTQMIQLFPKELGHQAMGQQQEKLALVSVPSLGRPLQAA